MAQSNILTEDFLVVLTEVLLFVLTVSGGFLQVSAVAFYESALQVQFPTRKWRLPFLGLL